MILQTSLALPTLWSWGEKGKGSATRDYLQTMSNQGRRGHATPHMPVETAKCWWLLKIEPSLSLKTALNPLKNGPKPYRTHQRTRELLRLEGQRRLHSWLCHPPTHLVLFLVTTSISPSLQAYAELHALFSYTPLVQHVIKIFQALPLRDGVKAVVSSPATPPKNRRGESLGALAKFLGCADVAFLIPELPIRSTRRAFT